jgi:hypothetical protein
MLAHKYATYATNANSNNINFMGAAIGRTLQPSSLPMGGGGIFDHHIHLHASTCKPPYYVAGSCQEE